MRILIATGIYPPKIGGPAQYAFGIEQAYKKAGHNVVVKRFGAAEEKLPTGIRHVYFLCKTLPSYIMADAVIVLDTWSVAFPIALLSFVFRKKFIVRTGGDFLWEAYTERTKKKVLLREFYKTKLDSLAKKERFVFRTTKWILARAHKIVFSTEWQKDIWIEPYQIPQQKIAIVENYIGPRIPPAPASNKNFVGATRNLIWKNIDVVQDVFENDEVKKSGAVLDLERVAHDQFLKKISMSYAVILVSLGDISPNMILDAIRCGKPFICTKECGLYEKLKDVGLWVDPLDKEDIKEKVLLLMEDKNYHNQCIRVAAFLDLRNWDTVSVELLKVAGSN